jgi:hypothetical protein
MFSRLWSRAWSPTWRLATAGVLLLVLHALWGYIETRRLEKASEGIDAPTTAPWYRRELRLNDAARFYEAAWILDPGPPIRRHDANEEVQRQHDLERLRAMEPSLEMLDRAATLPACRYVWKDELPSLMSMREVATVGSIRTRERLRLGDTGGALTSTISSLQQLRVFDSEPPLIGRLMRGVLMGLALEDVKRFLELTPPGPERARLQQLVVAQLVPNEIEAALTAERTWLAREIRRGLEQGFSRPFDAPYTNNWVVRPMVRHVAVSALDFMSRAIVLSRAPWPERIHALESAPLPWGPVRLAVPSLSRAAKTIARSTALTHAMADCLSVEVYRAAHGAPPETLADAHVDPFSGQPLKYRREESGYVVYSVGENGKDDGGVVEGGSNGGLSPDYGYRIQIRK